MKMFFAAFCGMLLTVTSHARLGETPDQCSMRYGNSTGQAGAYIKYNKDHVNISIVFQDGVSICEVFSPEPGGKFPDQQVQELLTANSQGLTWYFDSHSGLYIRADKRARARWDGVSLNIYTFVPSSSDQALPARQPTSGF